jgi:hypothetical protein
VDRPAGAAWPVLVTAVAVVTFFITVLLTIRTLVASSRARPPPSCVEMLSVIRLLTMPIGKFPACSNRIPPPSSLARLSWMRFSCTLTGPEPAEGWLRFAFSSPAIMIPPPSS